MDEPKPDAPENENITKENETPADKLTGSDNLDIEENKPSDQAVETGKSENASPVDKPSDNNQSPTGGDFSVNPALSKRLKKRNKLTILVLVLVLLIAAGVGYYFYSKSKTKPAQTTTKSSATAPSPAQPVPAGNTFYQTPVKLGNLAFFKDPGGAFGTTAENCTGGCGPKATASNIAYYQIGVTKTKEPIVVATFDTQTIDGVTTFYAIKSVNGHYTILGKLTPGGKVTAAFTKTLNANVTVDPATDIPEFQFPKNVTVGGLSLVSYAADKTEAGVFINGTNSLQHPGQPSLNTTKSVQMTKIGSLDGKGYYDVVSDDQPSYQVKVLRGAVSGVNGESYQLKTLLVDPNNLGSGDGKNAVKIKWKNGQTNTADYEYGTGGCGNIGAYVVTKGLAASQLTQAGTAPDGSIIYQVPETSALFKVYYTEYKGGTTFLAQEQPKSIQNLSTDGYQTNHGLIVMKNAIGEYVVYARVDMMPGGGCGKPVIYLYPQKTENVNVSVGAHITKSDPYYGAYGWQNVLAHPDGSLTYQGKSYGSLYWEGKGIGMYPLLGAGTVVPHAHVVLTIKTQLAEQGLNSHEISDFLTYWQPKLPDTPYTRLTWLGTEDMNQLAPLMITPKPQTVIRTFLDFQGLDHPIQINPQTFTAPQRNGFTVVEWGGLLHD